MFATQTRNALLSQYLKSKKTNTWISSQHLETVAGRRFSARLHELKGSGWRWIVRTVEQIAKTRRGRQFLSARGYGQMWDIYGYHTFYKIVKKGTVVGSKRGR